MKQGHNQKTNETYNKNTYTNKLRDQNNKHNDKDSLLQFAQTRILKDTHTRTHTKELLSIPRKFVA